MVRIPPRPRPTHLQELAGHVRADEVFLFNVRAKHLINCRRRLLRHSHRLESPMGQDLAFVRLDEQHSLLAAANAIQLRPLMEVDFCKVE
jgi:hypothetical protein